MGRGVCEDVPDCRIPVSCNHHHPEAQLRFIGPDEDGWLFPNPYGDTHFFCHPKPFKYLQEHGKRFRLEKYYSWDDINPRWKQEQKEFGATPTFTGAVAAYTLSRYTTNLYIDGFDCYKNHSLRRTPRYEGYFQAMKALYESGGFTPSESFREVLEGGQ